MSRSSFSFASRLNILLIVSMILSSAHVTPAPVMAREISGQTSSLPLAPDTRPPTAPSGLRLAGRTPAGAQLTWAPAQDDGPVTYHVVVDDGVSGPVVVGSTTDTHYNVEALKPGSTLRLTVIARDAGGNLSQASNALTFQTDPEPPRALIDAQIIVSPNPVVVGEPAELTLRLSNVGDAAADSVSVELPAPEGLLRLQQEAPASDPDGPAAVDGAEALLDRWRWEGGRLESGQSLSWTLPFRIDAMPEGRALLFQPQVAAGGLEAPVTARGGAVVVERQIAPATAVFTPGQPSSLSAGHLTITVPADLYPESLTLSLETNQGAEVPALPWKDGLGAFELHAINGQGQAVHQFNAPVTIQVGYTPLQLEALGLAEETLALFWFDPAQGQWQPLPTEIESATHTLRVTVDHFSYFDPSTEFNPSLAFVPSLNGWQISPFTGAASFSLPIDMPASPSGLKPSLQLTYQSDQTDSDHYRMTLKQASWVGKGWDLSMPYIARVKGATLVKDHFTLVLDGKSHTIVRGRRLPGASYSANWLQGWEWFTTDESFIKIRAVNKGPYPGQASGTNREVWVVWTRDGTKYEFDHDVTWSWAGSCEYEAYKWMLSRVTDPGGNTISYNYATTQRSNTGCAGTVSPNIWPTEILWGANPLTGATHRYRVTFESIPRTTNDVIDRNLDMEWDFGRSMNGGQYHAPHETRVLRSLIVWRQPASIWEPVRGYRFLTDYGLTSDASRCPAGSCPDTSGWQPEGTYKKLTLNALEIVGYDRNLTPTTFPAQTTFQYNTSRGDDKNANGGWNRLSVVNNGQGGLLTFGYENIAEVYRLQGKSWWSAYFNRHRVTRRELDNGRGSQFAWTYAYSNAALNSLGTESGRAGPNTRPNSAALYFWDRLGRPAEWLAVDEQKEFRGHEVVTETLPGGAQVVHYFLQGEGDSDTDPLNGLGGGCQPASAASVDRCFASLRDNGFQVGKEWKTEWKTPTGALLKATLHLYGSVFYPGTLHEPGSGSDTWPEYTRNGLWRAFRHEAQTLDRSYEGGGQFKERATRYHYLTTPYQWGDQLYGNLTKVEEYEDGRLYRYHEHFFARTDSETWTWNANNQATYQVRYLVDRKYFEQTRDGALDSQGRGHLLLVSHFFYDGQNQSVGSLGETGRLTRVLQAFNVPFDFSLVNVTLLSSDTTYRYDPSGNRIEENTYSVPATAAWNGSIWSVSAPDSGAARTTTFRYDDASTPLDESYSGLPVQVVHPVTSLVESAAYDYRLGVPQSRIDYNGNITRFEYDAFGRLTKVARPYDDLNSPTLAFTYRDSERPVRYQIDMKGPGGSDGQRSLMRYYDGLGREIQTKAESVDTGGSPADIVVDKKYDGQGQLIEQSTPRYAARTSTYTSPGGALFNPIQTQYDVLGRMTEVRQPNGSRSFNTYGTWQPSSGPREAWQVSVDPNRHLVQRFYDSFGRLVRVTEFTGNCAPDGSWGFGCGGAYATPWSPYGETRYTYNALDWLTGVRDALGNTTSLLYDSLGRKTQMTDPDMGAWAYTYDAPGNLVRQRDAGGQSVCFYYDALDRLTGKHHNGSNGTCPSSPGTVTYGYDSGPNGKGQRTGMTSGSSTTQWTYDARGRQIEAAHLIDGRGWSFRWEYNSADLMTRIAYPNGGEAVYTYDAGWRPVTLTAKASGSGASTPLVTQQTYTAFDLPRQRTLGNTLQQTWDYQDPMPWLGQFRLGTNASPGSLLNRAYTYDATGNVLAIRDHFWNETQHFTYDDLDRLTRARTSTGVAMVPESLQLAVSGGNRREGEPQGWVQGFDPWTRPNVRARLALDAAAAQNPAPVGQPGEPAGQAALAAQSTRLKDITFESGSLLGADGADQVSPETAPLVLVTGPAALKGNQSVQVNVADGYLRENFPNTANLFVTFYLKLNAAPSSTARIAYVTNGSTTALALRLTSGRQLQLTNAGDSVGSSSPALSVGTVYRVGLVQKKGAGNGVIEAYLATGDAPFGSPFVASAAQTVTGDASTFRFGATNGVAINVTYDDIRIDSAGLAPPSGGSPTPTPTATSAASTPTRTPTPTPAPVCVPPEVYDPVLGACRLPTPTPTPAQPPPAYDETYVYDAIGNLTRKGGLTCSYGANGNGTGLGPHRPVNCGGNLITYDANGSRRTYQGYTYTWNAENQLTRIDGAGLAETYAYDGDGERIRRTHNNGTLTTYDLEGLMEEAVGNGATLKNYYPFNGQVVAVYDSARNQLAYLHGDHLGSVSLATGTGGAVVDRQEFYPWGARRWGGMSLTSLNYTGQQLDSTGLLYYGARYYDPALGRFISADSIVPGDPSGGMDGVALTPLTVDFHEPGFLKAVGGEARGQDTDQLYWGGPLNPQALNRYSYVQNNPMNSTDPTGHKIRSGVVSREEAGYILEDLEYGGDAGGGALETIGAVVGAFFSYVGDVFGATTGLRTRAYAGAKYTMQKALRIKNGEKYIFDSQHGIYVYDAQGNYLATVPWQGNVGEGQVAVAAAAPYASSYGATSDAVAPNLHNPEEKIGWSCEGREGCGVTIADQERIVRPGDVTCRKRCFVMPQGWQVPEWADWDDK